jgi:predicted transcriptional regulator
VKPLLQRLFTSKARVKILAQFLTQPDTSLYIRQLARLIGEDLKNVSIELRNLEGLGLLQARKEGPLKYYSVNSDFPFYPELKSIFFKARKSKPKQCLPEMV